MDGRGKRDDDVIYFCIARHISNCTSVLTFRQKKTHEERNGGGGESGKNSTKQMD